MSKTGSRHSQRLTSIYGHAHPQLANFAQLLLIGEAAWLIIFEGPWRWVTGQGVGSVTVVLTSVVVFWSIVSGLSIGGRLRMLAIGQILFLGLCILSASVNQIPPILTVSSFTILTVATANLSLGIQARSATVELLTPALYLMGVIVFLVSVIQLLSGVDVDRITGLMGNQRASNTLPFFTLFVCLGLVFRNQRKPFLPLLVLTVFAILAWLGDAKAAIFSACAVCFISLVASIPKVRSAFRYVFLSAATFSICAIASISAAMSIGTGGGIPFTSSYFTSMVGQVGDRVEHSLSGSNGNESATHAVEDKTGRVTAATVTIGTGPGTGSSYVGLVLRQGKVPLIEMEDKARLSEIAQSRPMPESPFFGGIFTDLRKTFLGVLEEFGVLGVLSYSLTFVFLATALRKSIPTGLWLGLLVLAGSLLWMSPLLEYPEVSLGLAIMVVLVSSPRNSTIDKSETHREVDEASTRTSSN